MAKSLTWFFKRHPRASLDNLGTYVRQGIITEAEALAIGSHMRRVIDRSQFGRPGPPTGAGYAAITGAIERNYVPNQYRSLPAYEVGAVGAYNISTAFNRAWQGFQPTTWGANVVFDLSPLFSLANVVDGLSAYLGAGFLGERSKDFLAWATEHHKKRIVAYLRDGVVGGMRIAPNQGIYGYLKRKGQLRYVQKMSGAGDAVAVVPRGSHPLAPLTGELLNGISETYPERLAGIQTTMAYSELSVLTVYNRPAYVEAIIRGHRVVFRNKKLLRLNNVDPQLRYFVESAPRAGVLPRPFITEARKDIELDLRTAMDKFFAVLKEDAAKAAGAAIKSAGLREAMTLEEEMMYIEACLNNYTDVLGYTESHTRSVTAILNGAVIRDYSESLGKSMSMERYTASGNTASKRAALEALEKSRRNFVLYRPPGLKTANVVTKLIAFTDRKAFSEAISHYSSAASTWSAESRGKYEEAIQMLRNSMRVIETAEGQMELLTKYPGSVVALADRHAVSDRDITVLLNTIVRESIDGYLGPYANATAFPGTRGEMPSILGQRPYSEIRAERETAAAMAREVARARAARIYPVGDLNGIAGDVLGKIGAGSTSLGGLGIGSGASLSGVGARNAVALRGVGGGKRRFSLGIGGG